MTAPPPVHSASQLDRIGSLLNEIKQPPSETHATFASEATMVRYFFHIKCDNHFIEDEEGSEFETDHEARALAIKSLREMLAAAIKSGAAAFVVSAIVIADEFGQDLDFVPVAQVLPDWLQDHI